MGNQNCQNQSDQIRDNLKLISRQLDVLKTTDKGASGEIIIAEDKAKNKLYYIQTFSFIDELTLDQFIRKMKFIQKLKHPNLIKLKKIQKTQNNNMCSESLQVNLYFEYYERDLLSEFILRNLTKQIMFTLEEITFILKSLVSVLAYLQIHKISHSNLTLKSIFITNEGSIKLNENIFIKQIVCLQEQISNNSKQQASPFQNKIDISNRHAQTQILQLKEKQNFKNIFQQNVFQLGCLMLNLAVSQDIGNTINLKDDINNQHFIQKQILIVEQMYGHDFANTLSKMLQLNDDIRPDFIELAQEIGVIDKSNKNNFQEQEIQKEGTSQSSFSDSIDFKENKQQVLHRNFNQYNTREDGHLNSNGKKLTIEHQYDQQRSQYICSNKQIQILKQSMNCKNELLKEPELMQQKDNKVSSQFLNHQEGKFYQQNQQLILNKQKQYPQISNFTRQSNYLNNQLLISQQQFKYQPAAESQYPRNPLQDQEHQNLFDLTSQIINRSQNSSLIQSVQILDENYTHQDQKKNKNTQLRSQKEKENLTNQENWQLKSSIQIFESDKTSTRNEFQSNRSVIIESIDRIRENLNIRNEKFEMSDNPGLLRQLKEQRELNSQLSQNILYGELNQVEQGINKTDRENSKVQFQYLNIDKTKLEENQIYNYQNKNQSVQLQTNSNNQQQINGQSNNKLSDSQTKNGDNFQQSCIDSDDFQQIQSVAEFFKHDLEGEGIILLQNNYKFYGTFVQGKAQGRGFIMDQNDQIIYEGFYEHGVLKYG